MNNGYVVGVPASLPQTKITIAEFRPINPSPYDEEFDEPYFNQYKWAVREPVGYTTGSNLANMIQVNSKLISSNPAEIHVANAPALQTYLVKNIYAPPYAVEALCENFCGYSQFAFGGICLFDVNGSKNYEFGIYKNNASGNWEVTCLKRTGVLNFTTLFSFTLHSAGRPINPRFTYHRSKFQIRNDGAVIYFDWTNAQDGVYLTCGSESVTAFLSTVSSQVGLALGPSTSADYFRVRSNAVMNYIGDAQRQLSTSY